MITLDQSRTFGDRLASLHAARVYTHDSPGVALAVATLRFVTRLSPPVAAFAPDPERVSMTLPLPVAGTVIVLSPAAVADAAAYAETVAHECQHAHQAATVGAAQSDVDYLGSGELRATREAQAYVVGLFVRYLLTGVCPTVADAMTALASGLYHLAANEIELARGIVTSGVETMRDGVVPAYTVALDALRLLREIAPAAIVADGFRVSL